MSESQIHLNTICVGNAQHAIHAMVVDKRRLQIVSFALSFQWWSC